MRISEFAKRSGLTADTIRYYERIGLLPRPDRAPSGHRDYDASALVWVEFLRRLKSTGMPISAMLHYARLRAEGPQTAAARQAQLIAHREMLRAHLTDLQASLLVLDDKIAGYARQQEHSDDPPRNPV